jgi:hypothetical protein
LSRLRNLGGGKKEKAQERGHGEEKGKYKLNSTSAGLG